MDSDWLNEKNKVYIVTGGSSGVGEAIVKELLSNGSKVINADLNAGKVANENLLYIKTDVSNKADIEHMVDRTLSEFKTIDGLVNNAGINIAGLLVDPNGNHVLNEKIYEKMFNVNVKSVFLASSIVGKVLVKNKHGVIVNMSSESGLEGSQGAGMYSGTKGAINAFTRAWAKELGPYNVRCIGVAPGILEATGLRTREYEEGLAYSRHKTVEELRASYLNVSSIPLQRSGKLNEVANLVAFLLSDKSSYMTGQTINISGGKSRG